MLADGVECLVVYADPDSHRSLAPPPGALEQLVPVKFSVIGNAVIYDGSGYDLIQCAGELLCARPIAEQSGHIVPICTIGFVQICE